MNILQQLFQDYFPMVLSAIGGIVLAWVTQQILKKRGTFSYYVIRNKIAQSTEDAIFGVVGVTWNGKSIPNLYLSTVELINESMNDYENVVVRVYTNDTNLFTEQTQIIGTSHILEWSDKYKSQLHVEPGTLATQAQIDLHSRQREYVIPAMNRGQVVKLIYLNSAKGIEQPTIWLDVVHRGVKLRFRPPQNQLMGVPQNQAALIGVLLGLIVVGMLIGMVGQLWLATIAAFIYGVMVIVPGAFAIKIWRKLREYIGG